MNETNDSKWLNLSNLDINSQNILQKDKSKNILKYSTIDQNNTSNTQRVKVNITKKKKSFKYKYKKRFCVRKQVKIIFTKRNKFQISKKKILFKLIMKKTM